MNLLTKKEKEIRKIISFTIAKKETLRKIPTKDVKGLCNKITKQCQRSRKTPRSGKISHSHGSVVLMLLNCLYY